jgi:fructokinase
MAPEAGALSCRLGIDLGGSKIAGIALGEAGAILATRRVLAPQHDYAATVRAIADMVGALQQAAGRPGTVGIGMPGSIAPGGGGVQNANSTWLNGKPFASDLERALNKPVRLANDANCFALSEAVDGAGAGARSLFGVILGTGCGGGLVFAGKLIDGPRGTGGEWGHNPLPWADAAEHPGPPCWCGLRGCMETWVSGPGLEKDHLRHTGVALSAAAIAANAAAGDTAARAALARHASRLARGLAQVVNIFDPELVVLGGGLSQLEHLYRQLPPLLAPFILARDRTVRIEPPRWGDASGVRGAAWLWPHAGARDGRVGEL